MIYYQKLVRDKIPQIIQAQGETPHIRILEDAAFLRALEDKLDEEVSEFHRDHTQEELADILEVVFALAAANGSSEEELMALYRQKQESRGGFHQRIFLISKE